MIDSLEALLANGTDNALLRFSLGQAYFKDKKFEPAVAHLGQAVKHDPQYSAAWKIYGKALTELGDTAAAINAYQNGIAAAETKGDVQAAKEMRVFLRRLNKQTDSSS